MRAAALQVYTALEDEDRNETGISGDWPTCTVQMIKGNGVTL
jgi:hypothetical protein